MSDTRTGDTRTNDARPKRTVREPAHASAPLGPTAVGQTPSGETPGGKTSSGEAIVAEAVAAVIHPIVERKIVPEPDPVSAIALARAVPSGPACPVPAASERSPSDQPPAFQQPASDKSAESAAETGWTAVTEAQAALARGFAKAAVEMNGVSRSGIAATADAAVALLGARTLAEALEINAALARRSFDTMFEVSARLSEIGAEAVIDASRPMLSQYLWRWRDGRGWDVLGLS